MEKKFEVGKVYLNTHGNGCGYDECVWRDYYLITRKTEKSIWWKKITLAKILYGEPIHAEPDFSRFETAEEKRSKIKLYKDAENFDDRYETIYVDYAKEVK